MVMITLVTSSFDNVVSSLVIAVCSVSAVVAML